MSGAALIPGAEPEALWALFCAEARRVCGPESSSMPTARAEALLRSLLYTLAESPETGADLALRLRRGRAALLARRDAAKAAWEALCIARPAVRSVFLDETLRELGRFFRRYDAVDAADAVPCAIDYPLLAPLPEGLCGVSLTETYLRRLGAEFRFLRRFSPTACRALYAAFLPGWRGLCFNLCEPVFANALALAALGAEQEARSRRRCCCVRSRRRRSRRFSQQRGSGCSAPRLTPSACRSASGTALLLRWRA